LPFTDKIILIIIFFALPQQAAERPGSPGNIYELWTLLFDSSGRKR
jgi:hypothetical protein